MGFENPLDAVIENYLSSLNEAEILKIISLKDYDVILDMQKDSKIFRPTLFDFLAHRALDFFRNDESSIIQPAFRFELDREYYFSQANEFVELKIEIRDTLSLKFYAVEILQDLISFHLNDKDPTALIDADLIRLDFIRDNSILDLKTALSQCFAFARKTICFQSGNRDDGIQNSRGVFEVRRSL